MDLLGDTDHIYITQKVALLSKHNNGTPQMYDRLGTLATYMIYQ